MSHVCVAAKVKLVEAGALSDGSVLRERRKVGAVVQDLWIHHGGERVRLRESSTVGSVSVDPVHVDSWLLESSEKAACHS